MITAKAVFHHQLAFKYQNQNYGGNRTIGNKRGWFNPTTTLKRLCYCHSSELMNETKRLDASLLLFIESKAEIYQTT